jgi:hypothetical protein
MTEDRHQESGAEGGVPPERVEVPPQPVQQPGTGSEGAAEQRGAEERPAAPQR